MNSKRADKLGHWPAGKPRSPLTAPQVATVVYKLNRALKDQSMRAVAKVVGISDTTVRKIVRGEDLPSVATARKVNGVL
jgi:hypothetical protein